MGTVRLIRAKLQATTILSGGAIKELARRDQLWIIPIAALGVAAGIGTLGFALMANYRVLFLLGLQAGRPELLFSFALLASWALIFLLGIPVVVSIFFFSRDTAMLLSLPIRPVSIVLANAFLAYLSGLGMHVVMTVPALVVYAMNAPVGGWFVVGGLLLVLAGPLVPLALAVLLAFALTGAVNLSRYRIVLEVAGFMLVIGALIAVQVVIQRSVMNEATGNMAIPAALAARLLAVPRALPPLEWAARGLVLPGGPLAMGGFLALSLAMALGVAALAGRLFFRLTVERAVTRSPRLSAARYARLSAPRGPTRALVAREFAMLSANSTFLLEGVMEGLIFPFVLGLFALTVPREFKDMFTSFMGSSPWSGLAVLGVLALMMGINTVSSTSISREGRTLALSLMLPAPGRVQVRAKLLFHLIIFATGYVIDLVIVFAVLRLPLAALAYLVPGGAGFLLLSFSTSIFLDLRRPYLSWTHPQQAMKQNMNAMAAMGVSVLVVGAHAGVAVALWAVGASAVAAGVGVAVLALVAGSVALPAVSRYADRRYAGELEVPAHP